MGTQVVIGEMSQLGDRIHTDGGNLVPVNGIDDRAAWSWVRLQMNSRIKGDEYVKAQEVGPGGKGVAAYERLLHTTENQRQLQYIISDDVIKAVASTKHLLLAPEEVIEVAKKVDEALHAEANFSGLVKQIRDLPGFSINYQLDPGNIFTREAIRMGFNLRVKGCFNPLSFLGGGGFNRFIGTRNPQGKFERILRVEHKVDLEERIRESILSSGEAVEELGETIENSKKIQLSPDQAKTLSVAFPSAWSFGKGIIDQVIHRYREEDQSLWGLAQAASYVARHGEHSGNAKYADTRLGVVGAAYLNVSDVDTVVDKCKEWLEKAEIDLADYL